MNIPLELLTDQLVDIAAKLESLYEQEKAKQGVNNALVSDLYHAIEFSNGSASNLVSLASGLRKALIERRELKESLSMFQSLKSNKMLGSSIIKVVEDQRRKSADRVAKYHLETEMAKEKLSGRKENEKPSG